MITPSAWETEAAQALEEGRLDLADVHLIQTLAEMSDQDEDLELRRALAGLCQALRRGGVRLALAGLPMAFASRVDEGAYAKLIGRPGDYMPIIRDQDHIYTQLSHAAETEVARLLTRIGAQGQAPVADAASIEKTLTDILEVSPLLTAAGQALCLTADQSRAIQTSLVHPLLAISGGPGSGKTSLCANLLRAHRRLFAKPAKALRIALAAPTGRAAQRLTSSLQANLGRVKNPSPEDSALAGLQATTLHRLLGYEAGQGLYRRNADLPLEADLVVIDEASMVDLFLLRALLRALPPHARLILMGDKDQLPSVDAGSLLADLAPLPGEDAAIPWISLSGSHRSEAALQGAAAALLAGDAMALQAQLRRAESPQPGPAGLVLIDCQRRDKGSPWEKALLTWWERTLPETSLIRSLYDLQRPLAASQVESQGSPWILKRDHGQIAVLDQVFSRMEQYRLLTVLRQGPLGLSGVNRLATQNLQSRLDPRGTKGGNWDDQGFFHGAPVLLQRNDSARGLANGDMGLALRHQGRLWVALAHAEGYALWPLAVLPDPAMAFAITVHKSQGSEYDETLTLLPDPDHPLLTREVIYTAITRARKTAWLLGPMDALVQSLQHGLMRESGLRPRLKPQTLL